MSRNGAIDHKGGELSKIYHEGLGNDGMEEILEGPRRRGGAAIKETRLNHEQSSEVERLGVLLDLLKWEHEEGRE